MTDSQDWAAEQIQSSNPPTEAQLLAWLLSRHGTGTLLVDHEIAREAASMTLMRTYGDDGLLRLTAVGLGAGS